MNDARQQQDTQALQEQPTFIELHKDGGNFFLFTTSQESDHLRMEEISLPPITLIREQASVSLCPSNKTMKKQAVVLDRKTKPNLQLWIPYLRME